MKANAPKDRSAMLELRAAIAVAEHRSFRAAADDLAVSPTALSHTIQSLENRLGIRLFNRTTRSVALTAAGDELIARVTPLLAEIDRALQAAGQHATEPSGLLRLNVSVTAGLMLIDRVIGTYLARYPSVRVELVTERRLVDIVLGGCDAGIRSADSVPDDMVAVAFPYSLDFCVVASPSFLATHRAPQVPKDLLKLPCLRAAGPNGAAYHWELEKGRETFALDVPGALMLDDQSLLLKAAIGGLGLAYVSRAIAQDALSVGKLRVVLEDWTPRDAALCLYYPRNRNTSAALKALVEMIRALEKSPRAR